MPRFLRLLAQEDQFREDQLRRLGQLQKQTDSLTLEEMPKEHKFLNADQQPTELTRPVEMPCSPSKPLLAENLHPKLPQSGQLQLGIQSGLHQDQLRPLPAQ